MDVVRCKNWLGVNSKIDNPEVELPLVSVVIPTYEEAQNIAQCLQSIKGQDYNQSRIEKIIVDNNSTDRTKEIARKYTNLVFDRGGERSAQRNFGMMEIAKGKYVMFVDADMTLSPPLIREAVNRLETDEDLVGVYVPLRWVGSNWIIRGRGFEREFYDGTCLDAVRFMRTDIFRSVGGFDERLYAGEDWDLDKRIRQTGKTGLIRSCMYHHEDKETGFKDYVRKMRYYSNNLNIYISKYGKKDPDIRKQIGLGYRYFCVFTENEKWKKLVRKPQLSVWLYFLKIIGGIQYLRRDR